MDEKNTFSLRTKKRKVGSYRTHDEDLLIDHLKAKGKDCKTM